MLTQHLVTCALGAGFRPDELLAEVRDTHAYAALTDDEWRWALAFVVHGGASLNAYPEYRRVTLDEDGIARVPDAQIARRHRTQIGTIVSEASITVRFRNGQALGHVEESFVARLAAGDCFVFAGRVLEFVRVREMTAWVRPAPARAAVVPRWSGGKMALSTLLAERTRALIAQAKRGVYASPELELVRPLLELQRRWSALPGDGEWLIERVTSSDGHYLFFYPFEGRLAHLGLATLFSYRLAQCEPRTFSLTVNDYGFGLLSTSPVELGCGNSGACSRRPVSSATSSLASTPRRWAGASSARSRESPGWSSRVTPARVSRRGNCRRRAGCSTTSSPNTTRRTGCWHRRRGRCSSASSKPRALPLRSTGCAAAAPSSPGPPTPRPSAFR